MQEYPLDDLCVYILGLFRMSVILVYLSLVGKVPMPRIPLDELWVYILGLFRMSVRVVYLEPR